MENEQADAGRDGRNRLARPNHQARTGTGEKHFFLFSVPRAGLATIYPVDHTLLKMPIIHTYIPIRSTCRLHTNSRCGKKEARIDWSMMTCQGSTRCWNYLEDYWPCAGGLSAVKAIGTQLRDPINSVQTQWRMVVQVNKWTPPRKLGGIP